LTDQESHIAPLSAVLEGDEIRRDEEALRIREIAGVRPAAVLEPSTVEKVCAIMRVAEEERIVIVPVGGGTRTGALNAPTRYDAALSLARLDRVVATDADNFFVRVEAGCPLRRLEETLAAMGQCLPLDFVTDGERTVGGLISLPFVGARHPFVGAPRDVTLGLSAVLTGGKLVRVGGVTTKNVAGYDLTRLIVGSCGSLGIITELNLRTAPLPEACRTTEATFADVSTAFAFARAMAVSRFRPSFATVVCGPALGEEPEEGLIAVLVGAEGISKDVESQFDHFHAAADDAGASRVREDPLSYREALAAMERAAAGGADDLVVRVSAPMTKLEQFAELQDASSALAFVPAGVTILRHAARGAREALSRIDATCEASGAHRHVVSAPGELAQSIDVWSRNPAADTLMHAIKNEFDPQHVLSPGRMPGRL